MDRIGPLARIARGSASAWLLALGVPFGLAFALVTPPLQTPDELRHLARAFALSEGTLVADAIVDGRPSIRVPASLVALPNRLGPELQLHSERRQDPSLISRELARPPVLEPRVWRPLPSLYSPVAYLPQALGVGAARVLGLPVVAWVHLGRLANLAAFLGLTAIALRAAPAHATTLLATALLPMTLFLAASLSADAATNALAFAWLAFAWRAMTPGAPLSRREVGGLAALAAALGLAKPGYALLAALVLAVPRARLGTRARQVAVIALWLGSALVPGALWSAYVAALGPGPLVPGADPGAQLDWIAANPGRFAHVLGASAAEMAFMWRATFVGVLGHADTWLPLWLYTLQPAVLAAVAFADGGPASPFRGASRALALAIAAATVAATLVVAYLGWNTVGSELIRGVQGRYFTPAVPLALAALQVPRAHRFAGAARLGAAAVAALSLGIALLRVAHRYYG
jgi:hypothetical protein